MLLEVGLGRDDVVKLDVTHAAMIRRDSEMAKDNRTATRGRATLTNECGVKMPRSIISRGKKLTKKTLITDRNDVGEFTDAMTVLL